MELFDLTEIQEGDIITLPGLGNLKVIKKFRSYNRAVFLGERLDISKERLIVKTFPLQVGEETVDNTAGQLQKQIRRYWRKLDQAHVNIVQDIGFADMTFRSGATFWMVQFETYAGETCTTHIKESMSHIACKLVEVICDQIIFPLFANANDPNHEARLITGIDLNPRNITYFRDNNDSSFKATYVDLFPPKIKEREGSEPVSNFVYGLEYPEPIDLSVRKLGIFRHYDMAGLLVNFWINLCRIRPDLAKDFYQLIQKKILENNLARICRLDDRIKAYLQNRDLSTGALAKDEISALIEKWGFDEVFLMRLLACALAHHRMQSRASLDELFELTHFQNKPLNDEKIAEVKEMLFRMASFPVDNGV